MPVAEEVRSLAERTRGQLDAFYDFFDHSVVVWLSFGEWVAEGHRLTSTNRETGTRVTQDDLVRLSESYLRDYLAAYTFQRFVAVFESFLFDLLGHVLLHNPRPLGRKQVEFTEILDAANREEVFLHVVERELNEIKYKKLADWFEYLRKSVRVRCPSAKEVASLAEIKAIRDVLEHNAGVANDVYVNKAGKKARFRAGERVEIPDAYHRASWRLIKKVVQDVSQAVADKMTL